LNKYIFYRVFVLLVALLEKTLQDEAKYEGRASRLMEISHIGFMGVKTFKMCQYCF
jgi:hypothetical protein